MSKLLASSGFIVTTPNQENIQMDLEETGQTFEDNAAIKALAFAKTSGLLSIADDSGLEVEYLNITIWMIIHNLEKIIAIRLSF